MNIDAIVAHYVSKLEMVIPIKTLKLAREDSYEFLRVADDVHLCQHGDNAYIIIQNKSGDIGCSCPAMTFHCKGNDVCKHIAAFVGLPAPPQKNIPDDLVKELIMKGWSGGNGMLKPPEINATSDEGGEDNEGSDPVPPDAEKPEPKEEDINMNVTDQEKRIIAEAEGIGATDIDPAYVREKLEALARFKVPQVEAERSVVGQLLRDRGLKRPKAQGGNNPLVTISQIVSDGQWINLKVKVVQLWDATHESIRQAGVIGDETGTTKFTSWEKSDLPLLVSDKCYSLENVVTKEYEGALSVGFTRNTKISEIPEDIEVGYTTSEFSGVLVNIQNGSGLIKRCETCNRAMKAGVCDEHGAQAGNPDLRIKGVLDNGIINRNVLLNREMTEKVTGITLEDATALAVEAFDANVVAEQMRDRMVGREYTVSGSDMGDTILAENIKEITDTVQKETVEALLMEV
ncbi:MAG: hypothetical protein U9Q37_03090 [Euryarchaeota archaeon]|nr:hypothetical protein [Euryarchaeota archaeon]